MSKKGVDMDLERRLMHGGERKGWGGLTMFNGLGVM